MAFLEGVTLSLQTAVIALRRLVLVMVALRLDEDVGFRVFTTGVMEGEGRLMRGLHSMLGARF